MLKLLKMVVRLVSSDFMDAPLRIIMTLMIAVIATVINAALLMFVTMGRFWMPATLAVAWVAIQLVVYVLVVVLVWVAWLVLFLASYVWYYFKAYPGELMRLLRALMPCTPSFTEWYTTPGYHRHNRRRATMWGLACCNPCARGYHPMTALGLVCHPRYQHEPPHSGHAALYRAYRGLRVPSPATFPDMLDVAEFKRRHDPVAKRVRAVSAFLKARRDHRARAEASATRLVIDLVRREPRSRKDVRPGSMLLSRGLALQTAPPRDELARVVMHVHCAPVAGRRRPGFCATLRAPTAAGVASETAAQQVASVERPILLATAMSCIGIVAATYVLLRVMNAHKSIKR
jgi:hypothetical protein